MSATEPLTHVQVRGHDFFIPHSLTDPTFRCVDSDDGDDVPFTTEAMMEECGDADMPTAEERRILHELLTAVVLSATCRCSAMDTSMTFATDYSDDSEGVTNLSSHRTTEESEDSPSLSSSTSTPTKAAHNQPPTCPCTNAPTVACAVAVILLSCAWLRSAYD